MNSFRKYLNCRTERKHLPYLQILLLSISFPVILFSFIKEPRKIKIWLIGDSTMCHYPPSRGPITGWGVPFVHFFDSSVIIDNRARGGRSTRTFLGENLWKPVADSIREGDFVLIQFGHNDEAKEPQYAARYTPVADYKLNLARFVAETRTKRGIPVLITPVTRMKFDANDSALETHAEYTAAVFEVGLKLDVAVIDLDKRSRELLQKFGPDLSRLLFMQYEPGKEPLFPEGQKDNTHFNEYGARLMAQLVLAELRVKVPGLAERIIKK